MSEPDFYQRLVDQLFTYQQLDQITSQFQHQEEFLTQQLLDVLVSRKADATGEARHHLEWLTQVITYLYGRKCLFTFVNLPELDSASYAQDHLAELGSQASYNELESLIAHHAGQQDLQAVLKIRQNILATAITNAYVFATDWPQRRVFLLNSLVWLTNPAAFDQLTVIKESDPEAESWVDQVRSLIILCQQEGVESVVKTLDIDWLDNEAQQSQGEEKIRYLEQLIDLLNQEPDQRWATALVDLGNTYQALPTQNRADHLENAIYAYQNALLVFTRQTMPVQWATTLNNLGGAYTDRVKGKRADNLESAIEAFKSALKVRARTLMPHQWATTQNNLAIAYHHRIKGNKSQNLEKAIHLFEQSLLERTPKYMPDDWATTQNNLGNTYCERILGDRADNLEAAIYAYQQALLVRTRQAVPQDWAMTQNNLGNAYQSRIRGDRAHNQETAIDAFKQALLVRTRQAAPRDWAATLNNLGNAYQSHLRGDRSSNLEAAIKAYNQSLLVRTKQIMPNEWAMTQNNLGTAYQDRVRGERAENVDAAIQAYEQALLIYTLEAMPQQWAMTQNNLGSAYQNRVQGDQSVNQEAALRAYQQALRVRTRHAAPRHWATTQNNLGNIYLKRIRGDRAKNVELAIQAYELALQVRTRQATPHQWAISQTNLGSAYRERAQGERSENLEAAIHAYQQALEVRTKESAPVDCQQTALNLASLLYELQRWSQARAAYELAHESLILMRGEAFNEESRSQLSRFNANLYACLIHCCLLLDDIESAANFALAGKSRTLTEQLAGERKTLSELLLHDSTLANEYSPIKQLRGKLEGLLAWTEAEEIIDNNQQRDYQIAAIREQINISTDNLVFNYPALSAIQALPPITLADAQALSASMDRICLVEYIEHMGGWGAFIISAETLHYVPLATDLMAQIGQSLELFLDHDTDGRTLFWLISDWRQRLEKMYQIVFKPLTAHLPASGKLVLAPTKALHLVPFQALLSDQGAFISEAYAFSFVPSLATLHVLYEQSKRQRETGPNANRVLNVSHSGGNHNHLDNVSLEAKEVGSQFADPVFLSEQEATIDRVVEEVNKGAFQVVHFNCHGSFLPESPAHSGLLLANQQTLSVNDIRIRIRLSGRPLIALSACQTGQTLPEQGDETTGISWAFLAAGASAVLSSQWSVHDAATRDLFRYFYELRRELLMSEAEALRLAMLKVRKRAAYDNRPEYWAGFQVMGLPKS